MDPLIKRINELYHKAKDGTLTPQERQEQARLRQEYLSRFRQNLQSTLDNLVIVDESGTKQPVRRKKPKPQH